MKRSTFRLIIVLATLSIIGITITQIYWVRRAFGMRENQFDRDVNVALFNVANKFFELKHTPVPFNNPVKQLSSNYYVVMVNDEIDANLLEFLLKSEFEKKSIDFDFEYGIYNCESDQMVYGNYVALTETGSKGKEQAILPKWEKQSYYFGVQFPAKEANLINRMGIWVFSSAVLLLVIIFFAYALFVILKQKRLSEVQKDFINNMTHEFKTPISTIAISSEVLKNPAIVKTPERLLNYATIIQDESQRLKKQVERVLQMATLDKEEVNLKKEVIDMHEIIQKAIDNVTLTLEERSGKITCDLNASNAEIKADKLHTTNMIYNLLDNAVKYCKDAPFIAIQTKNERNGVVISIKDNGIGIAPEYQKKVFDKFYRVPTGNIHDVKGFGLGLNYVSLMVKSHGGEVRLESEEGQGSEFQIYLPSA
ncbi:MAG: HAMP domain-containing sensor histidine kinase [Bacteroidota bacterium]